ncbi:MAG: thioredoxin domain-containing protein [Bacteroidetes bacterium]|nr:MAG: thioredoxin domain-containing protein [Bacteroidota bacterium]
MPNLLIHESSPYLLQHAQNPVHWQAWNPEALAQARSENKLILVSIGYAACHWCHVMEHECFEDEEVAAVMNEYFVCIKVDREERPDVDKVYMDAVMLMTGRGGWPLNAFALPDGRPIYGGTYFKKSDWIHILRQLAEMYRTEPERAIAYAGELTDAIQRMDKVTPGNVADFSADDLFQIRSTWLEQMDFEWGGRQSNSNKFPLPANNRYLLRAGYLLQDEDMVAAAQVTMEKMAFGGIYDHLGGGFSRYSVDPYWKVPHFEKMLYDNGQLLGLYAEAWQQDPQELYQRVVYQTVEWLEREMTSPEGGFYSSLDADSEGVEGKFYTWSYAEIEAALGEDARSFADYYNVQPQGNWEHTNVLFVLETEPEFAQRWGLNETEFRRQVAEGREKLFRLRETRIRPGLDDKILCSWNALTIKGLADAYEAFNEPRFLELALRTAAFVRDQLCEGAALWRNFKAGKRSIPAFLDDYALWIEACLALYQLTFDEAWAQQAVLHTDYVLAHFSDEETGMFFYTSDLGETLIRRKTEVQDDVIPSSNSVMARNLHSLGLLLGRSDWSERAARMLGTMREAILEQPAWHAFWAQGLLPEVFHHFEVVITGPGCLGLRREIAAHYYPNRLFAGGASAGSLPIVQERFTGRDTVYVCSGQTCQLPVGTAEEALGLMGL